MSHYPTMFVFTHDSIGVGEDGPTHQPVETIASLRAIPGLKVFRPADANETARMWKYMLQHTDGPAATALTRQNLPVLDPAKYTGMNDFEKGAYILVKADKPDVLLLATGSEVQLALTASEKLAAEGISAQVVSMPCWELFARQDAAYRESVIPSSVKARVGVEAGIRMGWDQWLGTYGEFVGMQGFGSSGPFKTCFEKFGITADAVVAAAKKSMQNK
jgi:transketolase